MKAVCFCRRLFLLYLMEKCIIIITVKGADGMITENKFGELYGVDVIKYTLENLNGFSVSLINYGATVTNLMFDGRDLVLGYDDLKGYMESDGYLGATIGRYGNRIASGRFTLGGTEYDVGRNENNVSHLHGGFVGFDKQLWTVASAFDGPAPSLSFNHVFDDMEEGYPGELDVTVTFTVTAENSLRIEYKAISSKDTVCNLTNHSYFNLAGFDGGNVLDTQLCINADRYTPVDDKLIPTGELAAVEGTPFDFRQPKAIGRDINAEHKQLKMGGGYDHNFCLNDGEIKVTAYCPSSKIKMSVKTSEPGVQLYTANFLENAVGKGGPLYKHQAFCLETQHYPDSPNHSNFPSTALPAESDYYSVTEYIFEKE